ncbi:MAG: hypothetical protein AB1758_14495, partial [Candidatus Eremiobacterota bacterium]
MQILPIQDPSSTLAAGLALPAFAVQPLPAQHNVLGDLNQFSSEALTPEPEMGGFLNALTANYAEPPRVNPFEVLALLQWLMALYPLLAALPSYSGSAGGGGMAPWPAGAANGNAGYGVVPTLPYDGQPTGGGMDPERIHMTQVYDSQYNRGGAPRSADCGPTSL